MLSFTRVFTTYPSRIPSSFPHRQTHSLVSVKCSIEDTDDAGSSSSLNTPSSISPPPKPVEIRFKRGSRRRRKQEPVDEVDEKPVKQGPKDWESMTLGEKALELYMGEKGMLFWLNKFAYASIFIIIGGWIMFRFVGPALNLYQLDAPPLSPTAIFK